MLINFLDLILILTVNFFQFSLISSRCSIAEHWVVDDQQLLAFSMTRGTSRQIYSCKFFVFHGILFYQIRRAVAQNVLLTNCPHRSYIYLSWRRNHDGTSNFFSLNCWIFVSLMNLFVEYVVIWLLVCCIITNIKAFHMILLSSGFFSAYMTPRYWLKVFTINFNSHVMLQWWEQKTITQNENLYG